MFIDAKECGFDNLKNVAGINCTVTVNLKAVDKDKNPVCGEYRELLSRYDIEPIKKLILSKSKDSIENLLSKAEINIQLQ